MKCECITNRQHTFSSFIDSLESVNATFHSSEFPFVRFTHFNSTLCENLHQIHKPSSMYIHCPEMVAIFYQIEYASSQLNVARTANAPRISRMRRIKSIKCVDSLECIHSKWVLEIKKDIYTRFTKENKTFWNKDTDILLGLCFWFLYFPSTAQWKIKSSY